MSVYCSDNNPCYQDPPTVSYVLEATLHIIPAEVLDAPPVASDRLHRCSYADLASPSDRAGFNQSLTALKRAARDREASSHPQAKKAVLAGQ